MCKTVYVFKLCKLVDWVRVGTIANFIMVGSYLGTLGWWRRVGPKTIVKF
jgi:hypothetical protein